VAFVLVISARGSARGGPPSKSSRNPLQTIAALQMAAIFQAVLIVVRAAQATWGASGVLTTAAILGLADVDALTLSMSRGVSSLGIAALAIAVGVLANTILKAIVAAALGDRRFAVRVAGRLAASAAAGVSAIIVLSM